MPNSGSFNFSGFMNPHTMASGIYAIANIGRRKLYVGDVSSISEKWPQLLAMLSSGTHPDSPLQEEWNREGHKRYFTFHSWQEIVDNQEIVGIEQLEPRS